MGELRDDIPGWEGTQGPFPGQYAAPHVYARDIRSGAGNCVCGADLWNTRHVMAAPGVPVPGSLREQISFMIRYIRQRYGSNTPARPQGEG